MKKSNMNQTQKTIGLDPGDRISHGCVLEEAGEVVERFRVATNKKALTA